MGPPMPAYSPADSIVVTGRPWTVFFSIFASAGLPPEHYRFVYSLKGLYVDAAGEILERDSHVLEVNLSLDYPNLCVVGDLQRR